MNAESPGLSVSGGAASAVRSLALAAAASATAVARGALLSTPAVAPTPPQAAEVTAAKLRVASRLSSEGAAARKLLAAPASVVVDAVLKAARTKSEDHMTAATAVLTVAGLGPGDGARLMAGAAGVDHVASALVELRARVRVLEKDKGSGGGTLSPTAADGAFVDAVRGLGDVGDGPAAHQAPALEGTPPPPAEAKPLGHEFVPFLSFRVWGH